MNRSNMSRNDMLKKRLCQLAKTYDTGEGRTLEELKKSKDILKGREALRLRQFCTSTCMEPMRDLDDLGRALLIGDPERVIMDCSERLAEYSKTMEDEAAQEAVIQYYYTARWGPTEAPIFNLLGLFMLIMPSHKKEFMDLARFYIAMKVPVDGRDLSGTAALSHCFSTKPSCEYEYAQILYDAGGDVNLRNRYGATVAHEIVQVYDSEDVLAVKKATESMGWFLSHGGNLDIADGDGITPRYTCGLLARKIPAFKTLPENEDKKREMKGTSCCRFCGRDDGEKLLTCSQCKKAKYCPPGSRACQKLDWPNHKKSCKAKTN